MRILLIIIDGLGDRPIKELGNKTPLEAARTPNLDFLAENGLIGLIEPVYQGPFPTSKDAHLSLFGYDIKKWDIGRGVFEVLGMGMEMKKGDVALRGNFATVDGNLKIIDRRAGRLSDTGPLIKKLQNIKIEGVKFLLGRGVSHRLGIIISGKGLSDRISDTDLHQTGIKVPEVRPMDKSPEAEFTAKVLNKFLARAYRILRSNIANYILVRGAGKLREIPSFEKKWGLRACCIAGGSLYKGIGRGLGMEILKVKGATGKADTNLKGKFEAAKRAMKKYDFCFLHIKATDNFSHDGDYLGKKNFLEKIDKTLPGVIDDAGEHTTGERALIVITGDHSTPCQVRQHTPDPLPVLVFGDGKDGVKKFSEKDCQKGKLGKIKSIDFLKRVVKIKV